MNDIFDGVWTLKYAPKTLDDLIASKENREFLKSIKNKQEVPNLMLYGSPGIGKTLTTKIIATDLLDCQYLYINASEENGINDIRSKVMTFAQTRSIDGKLKIVIFDEADGLTGQSQAALRNIMEEYLGTTRFILTCNYPSKVIPALHSRCQELDMTPPFDDVLARCVKILKAENVSVSQYQKQKLVTLIKETYPDIRKCINRLQKNVIDNVLTIQEVNNASDYANVIFKMIKDKKSPFDIRANIIDNEMNFNNDYHLLLRSLFDKVYESDLNFDKKRLAILYLCEGMYRHNQVLDAEINTFSCIVQLSELFGYEQPVAKAHWLPV